MHVKQPGFTHSGFETFTKSKKIYKSLKKQEIKDLFIITS